MCGTTNGSPCDNVMLDVLDSYENTVITQPGGAVLARVQDNGIYVSLSLKFIKHCIKE